MHRYEFKLGVFKKHIEVNYYVWGQQHIITFVLFSFIDNKKFLEYFSDASIAIFACPSSYTFYFLTAPSSIDRAIRIARSPEKLCKLKCTNIFGKQRKCNLTGIADKMKP